MLHRHVTILLEKYNCCADVNKKMHEYRSLIMDCEGDVTKCASTYNNTRGESVDIPTLEKKLKLVNDIFNGLFELQELIEDREKNIINTEKGPKRDNMINVFNLPIAPRGIVSSPAVRRRGGKANKSRRRKANKTRRRKANKSRKRKGTRRR